MKRSLLIVSLIIGCISMSVAQADWRCNVHNARGQGWNIRGWDHVAAYNNAMRVCARNSADSRNCVVVSCFRN
ncbi:MAG: hypothetical protein ABI597_09890 [Gammaproteobacteria bacterium]